MLKKILEINKSIENIKDLIKTAYNYNELPWVVGFSGGKDSTTVVQLIVQSLLEMKETQFLKKEVFIISSDTLVETPMVSNSVRETLKLIKEFAARNDLPIKTQIVIPEIDQTFWVNVIGRGYPTPNQMFRWCTDRMKIDPANKFIKSVVSKHGEAIVVLGVREGESNSRDRVIENHKIKDKIFMNHTTLENAYVFAPILNLKLEELWNYLLNNESPWGGKNNDLYKMYSDSNAECPLIIDQDIKNKNGSCGNSRFGCWVCTVVSEDKSLTGFIESGYDWLKPLLEYRNWLYNLRDNDDFRMKRRNNGNIYFSKINKIDDNNLQIDEKGSRKKINLTRVNENTFSDETGEKWLVFDGVNAEANAKKYIFDNKINLTEGERPKILTKNVNGDFSQVGQGPFTLKARKMMLEKLLITQKNLNNDYELINNDELNEIRKIWFFNGDLNDSVSEIFKSVFGKTLNYQIDDIAHFSDSDYKTLEEISFQLNINFETLAKIMKLGLKDSINISKKEFQHKLKELLSSDLTESS
jgi:DNA sulfur modification protein DndC